jgi:hypothetical protein
VRRVVLLGLLPLALAACGAPAPRHGVLGASFRQCKPGYRSLVSPRSALAGVVRVRAAAYRAPGRGRFALFGRVNANDYPTVFGIVGERIRRDCTVRWYRAKLPMKPNGVAGWIRASAISVVKVRTRIVVDLSQRRVTLLRGGRPVVSSRAAIGAPATPTPRGSFYVNQRLVPEDPGGPFGPGAIGISAFSEVLTGWTQGGPVAIHGTNQPWLIGQAVSNGCIRLPNAKLRRIFALAVAGTPVEIRA